MLQAMQSLIGLGAIPLIAWAMSEDRRAMPLGQRIRWVASGIAIQLVVAVLLTRLPWSAALFAGLGAGVERVQSAVDEGARLVFGHLVGGPTPYAVTAPEHGFVLAVRILPMIIVLSAIIRLLYHWGVLQWVVGGLANVLGRTLGLGGPLAISAAASPFLGLIEAPLVVRPYLATMSRGALFAMIAVTMATVAGTVMALYASLLSSRVPGAAGHLLAGSLMSVPAALMLSRLAVPAGFADGPADAKIVLENPPRSSMDAITQGTTDGIGMAVGVAAMLIVAVALVAMVNGLLGGLGAIVGIELSLQRILGWAFAPLAFAIGIPWGEASTAGSLLGLKLVLNEFVAYVELAKVPAAELSDRSRMVMTYALCGFANLGSLGISIGGLSAMAPVRRTEIVELAPRAMLIGMLATLSSAAVMGLLTW